ncbi:MAG: gliding motility protein GldL [Bacteroidetes bacterium]|nr:MAG: gliding motility protein GldL [Bacteroidota bacterium]
MMSISELVESKAYKKIMAKVYGWGASVVLLGALFKIQHYPGASIMLIAGMGTEVMIFFLSAFEPLHEEIDWTLVYPELAGMDDVFDDEPSEGRQKDEARRYNKQEFAVRQKPEITTTTKRRDVLSEERTVSGGAGIGKIDKLLENANISPEIFEKLGKGLNKLSDTASKLSDITNASVATDKYINSMNNATESVDNFSENYTKSSEALRETVSNLSEAYVKTSDVISNSGEDLATSYKKLSEVFTTDLSSFTEESDNYKGQLKSLNKNLSALNAVYELALNNTDEHIKKSEKIYDGLDTIVDNLKNSAEETKKYKEEMSKLHTNLAELNNIYGNMLTNMNINSNN